MMHKYLSNIQINVIPYQFEHPRVLGTSRNRTKQNNIVSVNDTSSISMIHNRTSLAIPAGVNVVSRENPDHPATGDVSTLR